MPSLDHDDLLATLHYEPTTGTFTWRRNVGRKIKRGNVAGRPNNQGYHRLNYRYVSYTCHRLAWFYMTGQWPPQYIDHIDGDPGNNKWSNLRLANNSQNQANRRKLRNLSCGVKGVSWHAQSERWQAQIKVRGRSRYLGLHETVEAAAAAYRSAALKHFGAFTSDAVVERKAA